MITLEAFKGREFDTYGRTFICDHCNEDLVYGTLLTYLEDDVQHYTPWKMTLYDLAQSYHWATGHNCKVVWVNDEEE